MKKFTTFYFESFAFNKQTLTADFLYSFDRSEFFSEQIDFSSDFELREDLDWETLQSLLFHCHLALGISYYKLFPTADLICLSGALDNKQCDFWKKFYIHWLWEFLVKNDIDPAGLFQFSSEACIDYQKHEMQISNRALLPWWGWKDSIVSSILLLGKIDFTPYVFWKIDSIKSATLDILEKPALFVQRKISDHLFKLNKKWYYNGHVPITWIIAFISVVTAYLYDYRYIVLSNEGSADEPNMKWRWIDINHQYSKSLEFEQDFSNYIADYMTDEIKYFSLLRWFSEYSIAQIFSEDAQAYFSSFASCNKNFVITIDKKHRWSWCDRCEKCAFVYLILSAFLPRETLIAIFWEDLFEVVELESSFAWLIWYNADKPFECVWTYEESVYAMYKASKNTSGELPYILAQFHDRVVWEISKIWPEKIEQKLVTRWDEDIIPNEIKKLIFD